MTVHSRFSSLSRRDVLKAGGALIVTFAFRPALHLDAAQAQGAPELGKPLDVTDVDSFLAIHADGTVTMYTGKVDVGTGLRIAVAQMAAEELGIPAERITLVDGDTGLCPNQGGTGGSTGLTRGGTGVRQAAATARQALLALGATQLGRPAGELTIVDGQVRPTAGGAGVAIGALVGGRRIERKVDPKAPLARRRSTPSSESRCRVPTCPTKRTGRHAVRPERQRCPACCTAA